MVRAYKYSKSELDRMYNSLPYDQEVKADYFKIFGYNYDKSRCRLMTLAESGKIERTSKTRLLFIKRSGQLEIQEMAKSTENAFKQILTVEELKRQAAMHGLVLVKETIKYERV